MLKSSRGAAKLRIIIVLFVIILALFWIFEEKNIDGDNLQNSKQENVIEKDVEFTKTFKVTKKTIGDGSYGYITISNESQNQKNETVKIALEYFSKIESEKNYEFTFSGKYSGGKYDKISKIFEDFNLVKVEYTEKQGEEQVQDVIGE